MALSRFSLYVDADLGEAIKEYCQQHDISYTEFFRQAARLLLDSDS